MSTDTLRSFLVDLGFKVDPASYKKFTDSVETVTKQVMRMGVQIAAAAAGVGAATAVIAAQMERLYFASQRTGVAVTGLKQLQFAFGQVGMTSDQAMGAITNFAQSLRLNPGNGALLKSLGIDDQNTQQAFNSFIKKMKGYAPYVASAYAEMFNIDAQTLQGLMQNSDEFFAAQEKYLTKVRALGLDPEKLALDSKEFDNQMRSLLEDFSIMASVVAQKLLPVFTPLIERFEKFIALHADDIANGISRAFETLSDWIGKIDWDALEQGAEAAFRSIKDGFEALYNWLKKIPWDQIKSDLKWVWDAVGGIKGAFIALAAVSLAPIIGAVGALALSLGGLLPMLAVLSFGVAGWSFGKGLHNLLPDSANDAIGGLVHKALRSIGIGEALPGDSDYKADSPAGSAVQGGGPKAAPGTDKSLPRSTRNNNPGNLEYTDFSKAHGAIGTDGRFSIFPDMETGRAAAMALLQAKLNRGMDSVRKIIYSWAPPKDNGVEATNNYINSVAKKLGISADDKLDASKLSAMAEAMYSVEAGTKLGATSSKGGNVTIQQKTEITVHGAKDAQATAKEIGLEQRRVNSDLQRNATNRML